MSRKTEAQETLELLLELEPALWKYARSSDRWDLAGMRSALEHRKSKAADKKYGTQVVKR